MSDDTSMCGRCRFHHKSMRRKALDVADGELELVEFDEEPEVWFVCKNPLQMNKEMGKEGAGQGCTLFEEPEKKGLDPELERLLARRDSR
jgi:hypothetical protein